MTEDGRELLEEAVEIDFFSDKFSVPGFCAMNLALSRTESKIGHQEYRMSVNLALFSCTSHLYLPLSLLTVHTGNLKNAGQSAHFPLALTISHSFYTDCLVLLHTATNCQPWDNFYMFQLTQCSMTFAKFSEPK